jgi:hypothetical protein
MKIAVIVDTLDSDRRRHCFWEEQLSSIPDTQVELVSLGEQITGLLFDLDAYDIIIFNWDVLNRDVTFGADRSQTIVKNDIEDFNQFVRAGGIVIVEGQTRHWQAVQDAYDALLSGQITVLEGNLLENETPLWGSTARVNKQLKQWKHPHPLIHNLPNILQSAYSHPPDFKWFPPNTVKPRALQGLHPEKIYSGAFKKWRPEWLPLAYTIDGKYPIMLVKTDGFGLWVISTMFLASANIGVLIGNLLKAKNYSVDIRRFHSQYRFIRLGHALRAFGVLTAVVIIVYALLDWHVIALNIPFSSSVGVNILISLLIGPLLLWVLGLLFNYIRSRVRLAFNK